MRAALFNVLLISYALLSSVSTVATVINAFSNVSITLLSRTGKYFRCQHARAERVIVLFLIKNLGFQRLLKTKLLLCCIMFNSEALDRSCSDVKRGVNVALW